MRTFPGCDVILTKIQASIASLAQTSKLCFFDRVSGQAVGIVALETTLSFARESAVLR